MNTLAALVLTFLAVVVAIQLANGTAGAWLKAKFLNQPTTTKKAS